MIKPIAWTGSAVRLLDQTKLPSETVYLDITDEKQMHDAIKRLVVRGAPAIGAAAAFGVFVGMKDHASDDAESFMRRLEQVCAYLATSRPTAVNLFWALDRMLATGRNIAGTDGGASPPCNVVRDILDALLSEAQFILADVEKTILAIGEHGLKLLKELKAKTPNPEIGVLTHCNAGALAGTGALAPMVLGHERGMKIHVFADETRPLLQGSRITAYELMENGVPVTLICDGMAPMVLGQGKVDAVIVGADRIAANGDTANKIGTMGVAIAAKHFGVPFLVAAPISTIDFATETGAGIPIEQRARDEVANFGMRPTAPANVGVYNPAFDVTPANLVTAIVTEKGIARPPFRQSLRNLADGK